jgi:hypothetical protein
LDDAEGIIAAKGAVVDREVALKRHGLSLAATAAKSIAALAAGGRPSFNYRHFLAVIKCHII